jgi:hypothetical protein
MTGIESRIDSEHPLKTREQHAGSDQQDQCTRHLAGDQDAPHHAGTTRRGSGPPFFAHDLRKVGPP